MLTLRASVFRVCACIYMPRGMCMYLYATWYVHVFICHMSYKCVLTFKFPCTIYLLYVDVSGSMGDWPRRRSGVANRKQPWWRVRASVLVRTAVRAATFLFCSLLFFSFFSPLIFCRSVLPIVSSDEKTAAGPSIC